MLSRIVLDPNLNTINALNAEIQRQRHEFEALQLSLQNLGSKCAILEGNISTLQASGKGLYIPVKHS